MAAADTPSPAPGTNRPSYSVLVVGAMLLVIASASYIVVPELLGKVLGRFGSLLPVLLPAVVVGAMPKGRSWGVRITLGLIAAALALFVSRMWPGAESASADPAEMPVESHTILSYLIGMPFLGAIGILFMPRQAPKTLKAFTLGVMLVSLVASLPLLRVSMGREFHFDQDVVWIERFGIHYHVALDGISLWLVMLTVFTMPIAAYASFGSIDTRIKDWCFSLLVLQGAMIGALVAMDLFLFYVFWELMLIPMYVMIGVWGGANRIKAAIKFFLFTMAGSVLMLVAILYMAYTYSRASGGQVSFDYFELQRLVLPHHVQIWLWGAFALSFCIKVPMFPVHTWLPDAHTEAPTAGSIILAAVMLKMGTYGYLRFCMGLFPEACGWSAATLGGIAVLGGILYGALCAWKQDDVKRLVAYSSVAHLGYVMLGIFAATPSSLEGSVLQMVNHGVSTGALFLLVGVVYDRRHTRMLDEFGGIAKVMPVYTTLFIIVAMSSVGLPGTNGFVGEFMIITGTFVSNRLGHVNGIQAVGGAIGVILAALYMLTAVQKMFFGKLTNPENKKLTDINSRELIAVAPLIGMIFIIGFFPGILLEPMSGAVARIHDDYSSRVEQNPAPKFYTGSIKLQPRRAEAPKPIAPATGDNAPDTAPAPEGH